MNHILSLPWQTIASICVIIVSAWLFYQSLRFSRGHRSQRTAEKAFESRFGELLFEADSLAEKVALLEEHATDYMHSLNVSGSYKLSDLQIMRDHLYKALQEVRTFLDSGLFHEAQIYMSFLEGHTLKVYPALQNLSTIELFILEEWKERSTRMTTALAERLGDAAEKMRAIGVRRDYKRRSTLATVQELSSRLQVH